MKKILTLLCLFTAYNYVLADTIELEIGERYNLKNLKSNLWIEDPSILKVDKSKIPKFVTATQLGQSDLRSDNKHFSITVNPVGYKKSKKQWTNTFEKHFNQLFVSNCEGLFCLKGKITSFTEFTKAINIIKTHDSQIYFAFAASSEIKKQIQNWYAEKQRQLNLTPTAIQFSEPWVLDLKNDQLSSQFADWGLKTVINKNKVDLADNIEIDVKIVEVKSEFMRTLGIQWPNQYDARAIHFDNIILNTTVSERRGDMKILANPKLVCRSGKAAEFFAGGEFPIKMFSKEYGSVTWKKYGITLNFKPVVDPQGNMSIQIDTEISSIDKSKEVDGVPSLHTHKVSSYFDLMSSQTIVLSGLIKNESGLSKEGLPYLTDIPILGLLFSSQNYLDNKTELAIMVTPRLMRPSYEH